MGTLISGKSALVAAVADKVPIDRSGSDGYVLVGDIALIREHPSVTWIDDGTNSAVFSTGFIDTTVAPYNSLAVAGQSTINPRPATVADAGIWVLGSVASPAAVPVTRRYDSKVGYQFFDDDKFLQADMHVVITVTIFDATYSTHQHTGVIGTDIIEFDVNEIHNELGLARGLGNMIDAPFATIFGSGNEILGYGGHCFGEHNYIEGSHGSAIGTGNTSIGDHARAEGSLNSSIGDHTRALGLRAIARIEGSTVVAYGRFYANGDAQRGSYIQHVETTDATPTPISADGNAPGATTVLVLSNNASIDFSGRLLAREPATGDTKSWKFEGAIRRGANAAATALVAAVTPGVVAADAGAAAWTAAVTSDTTLGALKVSVTGEVAKTIQWVASLDTLETVG